MPRIPRKFVEDTKVLHIVVHAIGKEYIYNEDKQKYEYIKLINEYKKEYHIKVVSYCIMGNHAHMLVKYNKVEELSRFMQKVNTNYAIYYNKNSNREGYVYKNRFYSEPIMNENHFINAIIYIHNNPVKAQICKEASHYKFSSYNELKMNKEILKKYFINKENYKKLHQNKKCEYYFMEYDFNKIEEAKKYVFEYLREIDKDVKEISKDKKTIKDLCEKIRKLYKVSYKDIEEILNISSEKIRKIVKE